jgi:nucleoside-diphosphate-sugar epimerase
MRVLVTGATGFTGDYVARRLIEGGADVCCFVRPSSDTRRLPRGADLCAGDLDDPVSLERALSGMDALANVASIGFGHAPSIVRAAENAGVWRAVFISTTAIFTALEARSRSVRLAAEECVTRSRLRYTILRPTMIYGSSRDRNMCRLIRFLRRWRAVPVFGDGRSLQQPVYVGDVADAVVRCFETPATARRCYNLSGAAPLAYNEVIETLGRLLGLKVLKIHVPSGPVVAILRALERFPVKLPIKSEQILRLNENKTFDHSEAAKDFGFAPLLFQDGIRVELQELGLL